MAYRGEGLGLTLQAAADLSAHQYKFVKVDANGRAAAIAAATDIPVGVLQNKPDALGQSAEIMFAGVTKLQADAALDEGVAIGTSADGQADAKTLGTDTTEHAVGQTLQASGAAGEIIACAICCIPNRAS